MPYSDPLVQREYQRQWMADRRTALLHDRTCERCGTTENLGFSGIPQHGFQSRSREQVAMIMKSAHVFCRDCGSGWPNAVCANPTCEKPFRKKDRKSLYCCRACYRQAIQPREEVSLSDTCHCDCDSCKAGNHCGSTLCAKKG